MGWRGVLSARGEGFEEISWRGGIEMAVEFWGEERWGWEMVEGWNAGGVEGVGDG